MEQQRAGGAALSRSPPHHSSQSVSFTSTSTPGRLRRVGQPGRTVRAWQCQVCAHSALSARELVASLQAVPRNSHAAALHEQLWPLRQQIVASPGHGLRQCELHEQKRAGKEVGKEGEALSLPACAGAAALSRMLQQRTWPPFETGISASTAFWLPNSSSIPPLPREWGGRQCFRLQ